MSELLITDGFMDDLAAAPKYVEDVVWEKLALVETLPGVGSSLLSTTLRKRFGDDCLKLLADPYEIVYRWDRAHGRVEVLALVPQRSM